MDKYEIIKILEDWNFWERDLNTGFDRPYYLDKLKSFMEGSHIIVISGARRSGKSFIMRQMAKLLVKEGISKNSTLTVNFEDPRFVERNTATLQKIYEVYLEFLNPQERPYLFLDEIQEVEDWERWVRTIHELNKAKIVISGSNARLLSKERDKFRRQTRAYKQRDRDKKIIKGMLGIWFFPGSGFSRRKKTDFIKLFRRYIE